MKRNFTDKEKNVAKLFSAQNGEADHIVPWSKGGATEVENVQILSRRANAKKSNFVLEPREWQLRFFLSWDKRKPGSPFLLVAIPGSGKTLASLEVCRRWMQAGPDRRIIVVVPTDNLRSQWQCEAAKFGVQLQTKEFGTNFKDGFQGGIASYQLVASQSLIFRKLCSVAPTMVVFDEIHHCGDEKSFGLSIKTAFELAKEVLAMSGTPWQTDGAQIPFVQYDADGFPIPDYRYDYPDAINDNVVRWLVFDYASGTITNDISGEEQTLDSESTESSASFVLSRLLDAHGQYVRKQIGDAHQKLIELRKQFPDAGAMAACIDQIHAMAIARVIKEVTGCDPSVIISDRELENDTVEQFRSSTKEWLVCVRKVSEGTDIKRLMVLCYLTNATTDLFFRQLIGRVSRVRSSEDLEGYVYLPADPRLIQCAKNIEDAQIRALKFPSDKNGIGGDGGGGSLDTFSTRHDGTTYVLFGNERISIDDAKWFEGLAAQFGVPMAKVRQILQAAMPAFVNASRGTAERQPEPVSLEKTIDDLRAKCNKAAYKFSKLAGIEVSEVHLKFKKQKHMSESDLRSKLETISRWKREFEQ